jgi:hypothetical protein
VIAKGAIAESLYHQINRLLLFDRNDADDAPLGAVILELHPTRDFREDGVVLATSGVQPRPEPPAPLADDDRAAGDEISVVRFGPEALRVRIATVS